MEGGPEIQMENLKNESKTVEKVVIGILGTCIVSALMI